MSRRSTHMLVCWIVGKVASTYAAAFCMRYVHKLHEENTLKHAQLVVDSASWGARQAERMFDHTPLNWAKNECKHADAYVMYLHANTKSVYGIKLNKLHRWLSLELPQKAVVAQTHVALNNYDTLCNHLLLHARVLRDDLTICYWLPYKELTHRINVLTSIATTMVFYIRKNKTISIGPHHNMICFPCFVE